MNPKYILILSIGFLISCSTLDRRTYYTPVANEGTVSGPNRQACGMAQFGKEPDKISHSGLEFQANQSYEPYLWGPWLITVVPVFPFTWIVDGIANPELKISIKGDMQAYRFRDNPIILLDAELKNGEHTSFTPQSINVSEIGAGIVFPIKSRKLKAFKLTIENATKDNKKIELQFNKTSRWAWTQICIN
jgi:hypothetical protein